MGALGQLFLHFFVDLYLALVGFDLRLHLVILKNQDLCLLALMLQLSGELMVLQDRQVGRRL